MMADIVSHLQVLCDTAISVASLGSTMVQLNEEQMIKRNISSTVSNFLYTQNS